MLEEVNAARPTLWLWFVPFVNLVQQTEDALAANCIGLTPTVMTRCAPFVARAPVHGLALGVVVDEAHLGLDKLPNLAGSCFGWRRSVQTVRESKLAQ